MRDLTSRGGYHSVISETSLRIAAAMTIGLLDRLRRLVDFGVAMAIGLAIELRNGLKDGIDGVPDLHCLGNADIAASALARAVTMEM